MSVPEQLSVSELLNHSAPREMDIPTSRSTSTAQAPSPQQRNNYDIFNPLSIFDTITWIHVGPSKRIFGIHKGLLCYHSLYFRAALTGPFSTTTAAANDPTILSDEDPDMFSRFNCWIYAGKFDSNCTLEELYDLYIFASKRLMRRLQNAIVDEMLIRVRTGEDVMSSSLLNHAWSDAPRLRPFLIDLVVETGDPNNFPDLEIKLLSAVTKRSTDLWRESRIGWSMVVGGSREAMHVARLVGPFEHVCQRYHDHELGIDDCDPLLRPQRSW